jgi:lipopolysaccharide cholinephosphotransferase
MKELTLQEMKEIELELLKKFHSFCVENNIRYFISHGTLLGAIRYKGFIPWDDDVDLLVPREDYDRLLSIYQDSERYHLISYENNKEYFFPFAKFCDMTTRKVETNVDNGVDHGLAIDVFPLDCWDDDLEKAKLEVKHQKRNRFYLGLTKLEKPDSHHPVKRFVKGIYMALYKLRGSAYYVEKIIQCANKPEQKGSRYMGCKAWNVYGERDILPAEVFAEAIELEFEGQKFFGPVGYDAFLTSLYGDYLPEPPVEKRKTHHSFKAYRL